MSIHLNAFNNGCLALIVSGSIVAPTVADENIAKPVPLNVENWEHKDRPNLSIRPSAHLRAIYGETDIEDAGLAYGGHDPNKDGLKIQGISVGADFHLGEDLFGFTETIFAWDEDEGWDGELEEFYVKWQNLPGGLSIKGGRFFASVGWNNTAHNHEWQFVDTHLGNFRFLGDDGLTLEGVELGWSPPTHWDDMFIISFGNTVEHAHEEEEHHEEEGEGHEEEDEHGHNEEAEEALWDQDILTLRYQATFWPADTCGLIYGVNYVQGKNFMGKRASLYGVDITYIWLEDGDHGQKLTWTNEGMMRKVNTDEGQFDELAFSSRAIWKFAPLWEAGLRYDYLEGVPDPELPKRHRISPSITRYFNVSKKSKAMVRLQYNYDYSEERREDHSVWFMFGFSWGQGDDHVH